MSDPTTPSEPIVPSDPAGEPVPGPDLPLDPPMDPEGDPDSGSDDPSIRPDGPDAPNQELGAELP